MPDIEPASRQALEILAAAVKEQNRMSQDADKRLNDKVEGAIAEQRDMHQQNNEAHTRLHNRIEGVETGIRNLGDNMADVKKGVVALQYEILKPNIFIRLARLAKREWRMILWAVFSTACLGFVHQLGVWVFDFSVLEIFG